MDLGGEKRRIVVIGGGVAGSLLAKSIQFHSDLILIDQYAFSLSLSLYIYIYILGVKICFKEHMLYFWDKQALLFRYVIENV